MKEREKQAAILLDIENILFAACDDPAASEASKNKLVGYIIDYVRKLALGYAPSVRAYAALGFTRKQRTISWISFALAKADFHTMIVPAGPNAADMALYDMGLLLAADAGIETVVLATGDGREPFPELVDIMLEAGKRVHVVAYENVPRSLRQEEVEFSSLAADLRLFRLAPDGREEGTGAAPSTAPEVSGDETAVQITGIETSGEVDTSQVLCGKAAYRRLFRTISSGKPDAAETLLASVHSALQVLQEGMAEEDRAYWPLGNLLGILEAACAAGELALPGDREARELLLALIDFTDFFSVHRVYALNSASKFSKVLDVHASALRA